MRPGRPARGRAKSYPRRVQSLTVMAKAPLSGGAKTRLVAAGLDAGFVARLAQAFLQDTLRACGRVAGAELAVCFAPRESEGYFRELGKTS